MDFSIRISFFAFLVFLLTYSTASAQECTLDIGGKNYNTVIDIFQLNAEQQAVMGMLRAELEIAKKTIEEDIQKLFDTHPQSTQKELTTLGDKYKVLKEKMVSLAWESDKKLLETFNSKQYERYESLCFEAVRKPIAITPVSYKDSIIPE